MTTSSYTPTIAPTSEEIIAFYTSQEIHSSEPSPNISESSGSLKRMRTRKSSFNSDEVSGSQFESDPPSDDNCNDDDNDDADDTSSSKTSKRAHLI